MHNTAFAASYFKRGAGEGWRRGEEGWSMPCVEEIEKATAMPRGLLPPRPWLLTSLHFLLSRTSKAESLAIVSAPPSPFAGGGELNSSRLQRLNKPYRGARRGAPARISPAARCSARLLPPPHPPCPPPRALRRGLGEPPRIDSPEPSRGACPLAGEVVPSPTRMRGVMGGRGRGSAGSSAFLRGLGEGKGV